ncbi:MAG: CHAT domain-containing protein, partial [Acidimicrobiales bacterium]
MRAAELAVELASTDPRRAAALIREVGRPGAACAEALAVARRAEGLVASARGDLRGAIRNLRDAIGLADRSGLPSRAAEARASLSYVLVLTGATADALLEVDRAATVLGGVRGAQVLMQRALILTELGRFSEAEAGFEHAIRALRGAGGDALVEGDLYTNRSILHSSLRAWRAADDDLARAAGLYARVGHDGRLALVEHNRAATAVIRGDLPAAFAHFDEAERRYDAQGRHLGLLPVERAEALLSARLIAEARAAAQAGVDGFASQRNAVDLVRARLILARAALAGGHTAEAREEADGARRSALTQRRPGWAAMAGYVALRARWDGGDRGKAMVAAGRRALRELDSGGWVVEAADARLIVSRLLLDLGRTADARRVLGDSAAARWRGPADLRARAWHAEALLRLATGDRRGAGAALHIRLDVLHRFRAGLDAPELRAAATGACV